MTSAFSRVPDAGVWAYIQRLRDSMRFHRKHGNRAASKDYLKRALFWLDEMRSRQWHQST